MLSELKSLTSVLHSYFTWLLNMSPEGVTAYILVMFVTLFAIFEYCDPRDKWSARQLRQSYRTNMGLFAFNSVSLSLLSVPSLLLLADRYSDKGLLNFISNPVWKAVLAFLAIDLLMYFWHKASHKFDCLWMFHKVHHNDPYLNVSTAFRIHFLEILIINVMKALLIIVLGIQWPLLLANEAIMTLFTMMHHTNTSFRGEQVLGRVIITPYLHRVHHSTLRHEHDRNFGTVLSIWDRLFGTLAELKPAAIGIDGSSPEGVINLVMCGFTRRMDSASTQVVNLEQMIAEAAYYKAEKRGFSPGNELRDWLEAKAEIIRWVYGEEEQARHKLIQKWRYVVGTMTHALNGKHQKYPMFWKQTN